MFFNGHIQTVFPAFFRRIRNVTYNRERITTPDNDFMDLDWSRVDSDRVAVILHGLEGHSEREYMRGMVRACNRKGWDAVAVNFRGCSGEPNRLLISYHHGKIDDLHTVVSHILEMDRYRSVSCPPCLHQPYTSPNLRAPGWRFHCYQTVSQSRRRALDRGPAETGS